MIRITVLFILATGILAATAQSDKKLAQKENERALLRSYLENSRDSLQLLITRQYTLKQQAVEQREADKEELDRLRERQGRLENELSRIKEERLSREQSLDDERKRLENKRDEWEYTFTTLKDLFTKEADNVSETFLIDREQRRGELEQVRSELGSAGAAQKALNSYVQYRLRWFAAGDTISLVKATVLPLETGPTTLALARFGNVAGYGVDQEGQYYYLRQTGRLGSERYSVERIKSSELIARIAPSFTRWLEANRIEGPVVMEVMQNDQARMLISGMKRSWWQDLMDFTRKGGFIMWPIYILGLWALLIVIAKAIHYRLYGSLLHSQTEVAMRLLNDSDPEKAGVWAGAMRKGVIARMVRSVLERRELGRDSAERSVQELITLETPRLNRNLNTLAVIAGTAPLMGLLGTVSGMISLFAAVTNYGTGDPKFLAGGISEALITTKAGMAVAIPVMLVHDFLRTARDLLVARMDKSSIAILHTLFPGE